MGGGAVCCVCIFTQEDGERDRKRKSGFCRGASRLLSPRTENVHWEAAEAGRLQEPGGGGWRVEGAAECGGCATLLVSHEFDATAAISRCENRKQMN